MGSESDCNNFYNNPGSSALLPSYYQNSDSQTIEEPLSNLTDLSNLSNEHINRCIREPFLITSSSGSHRNKSISHHQSHHQIPSAQVLKIHNL